MNAKFIIDQFGGQTALARLLGRPQSTVSYWAKQDTIPGRWWPELLKLAREQGFDLTASDFITPREAVEVKPSSIVEAALDELPDGTPAELREGGPLVPVAPDESNFLFYQAEDGAVKVQVLIQEDTAWASQRVMAEIFDVDVSTVSEHLQNIFRTNELSPSTVRKFRTVAPNNKTYDINFYNLDAIISVGYRVNSYRATQFRRWATSVLREYLIKGFALNDDRLKQGKALFGKDYFDELLERIREIRASERRFYQKITDLYAQCSIDYDKDSPITHQFYAHVQDKLHFATTGHTAAELIYSRADASKPHMGLTSWKNEPKGGKVTKLDVVVGKSYLTPEELDDLNRLVSMYLDSAENFARRRVAMTMKDWAGRLDAFLQFNAYEVLDGYGKVSRETADRHAEQEYAKYRVLQDREFKSDFDKVVDEVRATKRLPKSVDSKAANGDEK